MCRNRPLLRGPGYRHKRRVIREILVLIAREGSDPFTVAWLRDRVWSDWIATRSTDAATLLNNRDSAINWLRVHGFISEVLPRRSHLHVTFELTEQAIRWLDWTGFEWSTRKAA